MGGSLSITGNPEAILLVSSTVFQYPLILQSKRSSVRVKHLTLEHSTTQNKIQARAQTHTTGISSGADLWWYLSFPFFVTAFLPVLFHISIFTQILLRENTVVFLTTQPCTSWYQTKQTNKQTTGKKIMDLLYSSFRWHSATRNILISIEKDASLLPTPYWRWREVLEDKEVLPRITVWNKWLHLGFELGLLD